MTGKFKLLLCSKPVCTKHLLVV